MALHFGAVVNSCFIYQHSLEDYSMSETDPVIPATLDAAPAAEPSADPRLQRIADYRAESLRNPNALLANLGAANSDLMLAQFYMTQMLNSALASMPRTLSAEVIRPTLDQILRVAKQTGSYAQLEVKIKFADEATRLELVRASELQG
jgi:hypothetical protein